ncbi:MAG: 3'-5' exonuclease [Acidobacteriota bacterium]
MPIVFFDIETTGLDHAAHEICQIAAVAIGKGWVERDALEVKLHFDDDAADPQSLQMNSYDPQVWEKHAVSPEVGIQQFSSFLQRHAEVPKVSRRGKPYKVAQLAGHNIATFDMLFVRRAFKTHNLFLPAEFLGLDTLQLAAWWRQFQNAAGQPPENLKLSTLSNIFGIDHDDAHDALADVRANVLVAKAMIKTLGLDRASMLPSSGGGKRSR